MCGIIILYGLKESHSRPICERMTRALLHRGPDGQGIYCHNKIAFGHTRLSIVDIDGGIQPLVSSDHRFVITFNGEIYNYRELRATLFANGSQFNTQSDTEVIVELYRQFGNDCVHHLKGMFSFAIYDNVKNTIFVARDRLGIKPLYYYQDDEHFVAASEIKAIFASGLVEPQFNLQSIRNYFTYQFAIAPYTLFEGILELEPGHYLEIADGQIGHPVQYWDLKFVKGNEYESLDEHYWRQKFSDALDNAAATHTIGEVPIGAYLSGGIDSSTTTYYLNKHSAIPPHTFSIHFTNPNMDESAAYKLVAEKLGVENDELSFDDNQTKGFIQHFADALYHLEQPQRLGVDIPHFLLSAFVQSNQYKVVYTGDGADEILAGYDCFRQDSIRVWGNDQPNMEEREKFYMKEFSDYFSEDYLQLLLQLHEPSRQEHVIKKFNTYPAWYDYWQILAEDSRGLFTDDFRNKTELDSQMPQLIARMSPKFDGLHPINKSLYIETKTRLPGWILMKSDRLSMAHGVEVRVPFLDHDLVELAAQMPPQYKLQGMDEKYILKRVMEPYLPRLPSEYKKRGFYTPIREWFFTTNKMSELEHYLNKEQLEATGIFNPEAISELFTKLCAFEIANNLNELYAKMKLEWELTLVLSVQILYKQFIAKEAACFKR